MLSDDLMFRYLKWSYEPVARDVSRTFTPGRHLGAWYCNPMVVNSHDAKIEQRY